jgi:hypothetical protein
MAAAEPTGESVSTTERMSWWDWTDQKLNPVLVKDVRAWLRSRSFLVFFFLALALGQYATVNFVILAGQGEVTGRLLFSSIAGGLAFVLGCVLPFMVMNRFLDELRNKSTELALISRMSAAEFVRGKIWSGVAAAAVYFAAAGPSLMIAYMLGGVDLASGGLALAGLVYGAVLATLLSVLVVVAFGQKVARVAGLLLVGAGISMASAEVGFLEASRGGRTISEPEFWVFLGCAFWTISGAAFFFYRICISRLTFRTDNRDTGPRLTLTAYMLGTLAVFMCTRPLLQWTGVAHVPRWEELYLFAGMLMVLQFGLGVLFLMDTPRVVSRRVQSLWPQSRLYALLFFPGRGRLFAYIVAHLALLLCIALPIWADDDEIFVLFAGVVCLASALSAGTLVHAILARYLERKGKALPMGVTVFTVVITWGVLLLGLFLMIVVAVGHRTNQLEWVMLFCPISAWVVVAEESDELEALAYLLLVHGPIILAGGAYWLSGVRAAVREGAVYRRERMAVGGEDPDAPSPSPDATGSSPPAQRTDADGPSGEQDERA